MLVGPDYLPKIIPVEKLIENILSKIFRSGPA